MRINTMSNCYRYCAKQLTSSIGHLHNFVYYLAISGLVYFYLACKLLPSIQSSVLSTCYVGYMLRPRSVPTSVLQLFLQYCELLSTVLYKNSFSYPPNVSLKFAAYVIFPGLKSVSHIWDNERIVHFRLKIVWYLFIVEYIV